MKKHGFTLVELLVSIVILLSVIAMIGAAVRSPKNTDSDELSPWFSAEYENARSQRKIANELKRQNDLMERQLKQSKRAEFE